MKKVALLGILASTVLVAGCNTSSDTDLSNIKFDVEACNQYFQMIECVLTNEEDDSYTPEMRNSLREEAVLTQKEWKSLDTETLEAKCNSELEKFASVDLESIGCSIK